MYANLILSKEKCQIGFFDTFAMQLSMDEFPDITKTYHEKAVVVVTATIPQT